MKNFEELSFEEMQEVDGGLGFWETVAAGLIVATAVAIIGIHPINYILIRLE